MEATATDSLSDAIATTAVLAAVLVGRFTSLMIDGWVGLVVACFILFSGYQAAKETWGRCWASRRAGAGGRIQQMVPPPTYLRHPRSGDPTLPRRMMVSLHAGVRSRVLELHIIDTAEMGSSAPPLRRRDPMDPIITDD